MKNSNCVTEPLALFLIALSEVSGAGALTLLSDTFLALRDLNFFAVGRDLLSLVLTTGTSSAALGNSCSSAVSCLTSTAYYVKCIEEEDTQLPL